ncbi:3-oxoacyl-[acyl-carrier protein] reductase [Lachnospiraceae bacterium TWA4]|nr:3-oxoacyl-[acyl-carrier protein] reductase [Lachnospiraceae bacterium TWA4]
MDKPVTIITGASRGIGYATADYLISNGCPVGICCRNPENEVYLQELKSKAQRNGLPCTTFVGDMGDYNICKEFIEKVREELGPIEVLINNAAVSYIGLFQDMMPDEWNYILSSNLTSVYNCINLTLPDMIHKHQGKIINLSSVWGIVGASCEVAYSATKGGINALTRSLAKEVAPSKIQVNAIACGAIDTEMNHFLSKEDRDLLEQEIPYGRMGRTSEVAKFIWQLMESSNYLTGQVISFDGGWI